MQEQVLSGKLSSFHQHGCSEDKLRSSDWFVDIIVFSQLFFHESCFCKIVGYEKCIKIP